MRTPRRRVLLALQVLLAIVALVVALLAIQIDDWRRDFSTNFASTSDDARDPLLRPLRVRRSLADTVELVRASAAALPRWRAGEQTVGKEHARLAFVRKTLVFRFEDDIVVAIEPSGAECTIRAESRSRVGKGDLGQNPRNLRELFAEIATRMR